MDTLFFRMQKKQFLLGSFFTSSDVATPMLSFMQPYFVGEFYLIFLLEFSIIVILDFGRTHLNPIHSNAREFR